MYCDELSQKHCADFGKSAEAEILKRRLEKLTDIVLRCHSMLRYLNDNEAFCILGEAMTLIGTWQREKASSEEVKASK